MQKDNDITMTGTARIGQGLGPYDIGDFEQPPTLDNSHLDLGSVLVPVVEGGEVTVELSQDHQPQGVFLVTQYGRINVAAYAAPRTSGLWREVMGELSESLRNDGASVSYADGHWGREVVGEAAGARHRFIGVDGPRWMVRCVASGPIAESEQLEQVAKAVLSESVVRRGTDPVPPREPLPIVLPPVLAEQVVAAQQQFFEQMAQENATSTAPAPNTDAGQPSPDGQPEAPSAGSAMQQLRHRQQP